MVTQQVHARKHGGASSTPLGERLAWVVALAVSGSLGINSADVLAQKPSPPQAPGLVVRQTDALPVSTSATQIPVRRLFQQGKAWDDFLAGAQKQRERWLQISATASTPPGDFVARLRRVAPGLRVLIVAEDWCPDSVEVVPYIVALAEKLNIPVRLLDRRLGAPLLERFRSVDGRAATPTIVLVRDETAVTAWIERPSIVQRWFFAMATSPDAAKRFNDRRAWFDRDRGRTFLEEIVTLAERSRTPLQ